MVTEKDADLFLSSPLNVTRTLTEFEQGLIDDLACEMLARTDDQSFSKRLRTVAKLIGMSVDGLMVRVRPSMQLALEAVGTPRLPISDADLVKAKELLHEIRRLCLSTNVDHVPPKLTLLPPIIKQGD